MDTVTKGQNRMESTAIWV